MLSLNLLQRKQNRVISEPQFVKTLFGDARFSILWLVVRVWLGYQWIDAASHKIGVPAWTETGEALKGYWMNAVAIPEAGRPPITFDWYRGFLQSLLDANAYTWFAKLVAYGELLIGIALIIGAFVGIAAFFGAVMNMNFMLAGSASTNPVLFIVALGLIGAWKIGGFIGADYFLLNLIGTPWNRNKFAEGGQQPEAVQPDTMPVPAAGD
ncbi:MAG: DoxX family membrane protein [Anaerolineae bacterium]|nr:DoxX family membrane protein [Anaerolineae bacterium]